MAWKALAGAAATSSTTACEPPETLRAGGGEAAQKPRPTRTPRASLSFHRREDKAQYVRELPAHLSLSRPCCPRIRGQAFIVGDQVSTGPSHRRSISQMGKPGPEQGRDWLPGAASVLPPQPCPLSPDPTQALHLPCRFPSLTTTCWTCCSIIRCWSPAAWTPSPCSQPTWPASAPGPSSRPSGLPEHVPSIFGSREI